MKPLLVLCLTIPAFAQPEFTVASMKSTELLPDKRPIVNIDPGRINLTGLTLQTLIGRAYSVKDYQVKGPDSVLRERYTILATMPPDTAEPVIWQMLQKLLADRLELKLRRGPEEMAVFALVPAKNGPRLKPATGGEQNVAFRGGAVQAKNTGVQSLVNLLGVMVDRPVVDASGLTGTYDFNLSFTPDAMLGPGMKKMSAEMEMSKTEGAGGSIFTALQEQLGLKLEPRKAPIEVLTVEKALKVPIEN
jgi:uncharacterized protein (TIGR03435 family)